MNGIISSKICIVYAKMRQAKSAKSAVCSNRLWPCQCQCQCWCQCQCHHHWGDRSSARAYAERESVVGWVALSSPSGLTCGARVRGSCPTPATKLLAHALCLLKWAYVRFGSPLISSLPMRLFFGPFIWLNIKNIPFFECNLLYCSQPLQWRHRSAKQHQHLESSTIHYLSAEHWPNTAFTALLSSFTWAHGSPSDASKAYGHQSRIPLAFQTRPDQSSRQCRLWGERVAAVVAQAYEPTTLNRSLLSGQKTRSRYSQLLDQVCKLCRHIAIEFTSLCRFANICIIRNIARNWLSVSLSRCEWVGGTVWRTADHCHHQCPHRCVCPSLHRLSAVTQLSAANQVMPSESGRIRSALWPIITNTSFANCLSTGSQWAFNGLSEPEFGQGFGWHSLRQSDSDSVRICELCLHWLTFSNRFQ